VGQTKLPKALGPLKIAHLTIAQMIGCDPSTVKRALDSLIEAGVIVKRSGKRQMVSNTYSVQIDKLPMADAHRKIVVSDDAYKLADRYLLIMRRDHGQVKSKSSGRMYSRKLPAGWRNRWAYVFQKRLDMGNSGAYLFSLLELASKNFSKEFVIGPQAWMKHVPPPPNSRTK
jgi:hypothetical protein